MRTPDQEPPASRSALPADDDAAGGGIVAPVNRRITAFILLFATMSLLASVLPLWPGIERLLPIDAFSRDGALALYAGFLVYFMLLVFPLWPDHRRPRGTLASWWWLGALVLAFAAVPMFVLAYIAGVHVNGVAAILALAVILHGLMLIGTVFARGSYRAALVTLVAAFTVFVPILVEIRWLLIDGAAARHSWQPITFVLDVARRFVEPPAAGLFIGAALTQALALFVILRGRSRASAAGLAVLLVAFTFGFTRAASDGAVDVRPLHADFMAPGRPWPLHLAARSGDARVVVDVAGRERYHWRAGEAGARESWLYPVLREADDRVRVVDERTGAVFAEWRPTSPPVTARAAVATIGVLPDELRARIEALGGWIVPCAGPNWPSSWRGWYAASVIVADARAYESLRDTDRRALLDRVALGATIVVFNSDGEQRRDEGRGRLIAVSGDAWPDDVELPVAAYEAHDVNLFSNFLVPDWGAIDLTRLLIFLAVYHGAFFLAFLLPLLLDARKSLGVYVSSVTFVVALLVFGGYRTLKVIFLKDTQILQQDAALHLLCRPDGGDYLLTHQVACFASFNGAVAPLHFDDASHPLFASDRSNGAGDVDVAAGAGELVLPHPALDRRRRKLAVKMTAVTASPFDVVNKDGVVTLRPRPSSSDPFGWHAASIRAAFVRDQGRIVPAILREDGSIVLGREPATWSDVLPSGRDAAMAEPFVRYLLGRHLPGGGPTLILVARGLRPLHADPRYLMHKDLITLLAIPL